MKSDRPLPRAAAVEDAPRKGGWAATIREAEVELERWVERRRRIRQRDRTAQNNEGRKDVRRA